MAELHDSSDAHHRPFKGFDHDEQKGARKEQKGAHEGADITDMMMTVTERVHESCTHDGCPGPISEMLIFVGFPLVRHEPVVSIIGRSGGQWAGKLMKSFECCSRLQICGRKGGFPLAISKICFSHQHQRAPG